MTTRDEVRTETIKLKEPKSNRALTTREQIILLEASRLHGCRFPPWKNTPDDIEFELDASKVMFMYVDVWTILYVVSNLRYLTMIETRTHVFGSPKFSWQCLTAGGGQTDSCLQVKNNSSFLQTLQ